MPGKQENNRSSGETHLNIALAGNPNTGKSSLFNILTGLNQRVGNFPGVTVDKKTGTFTIASPYNADIPVTCNAIDLPGTYSLDPKSPDEEIVINVLQSSNGVPAVDRAILVADASSLKRSLLLCTQVIDLGIPSILALNMDDVAIKKGIHIKADKLSAALGIPVVKINARTGSGIGRLKETLAITDTPPLKKTIDTNGTDRHEETVQRYKAIDSIIAGCVELQENTGAGITQKLDSILTHKVFGYFIFIAILLLIFQSIFSWAAYPMELIETAFGRLSSWVAGTLPPGLLNDLLVEGVLAGLSGVVIFIPQIALLFAFIGILEDTGYMSRVSFIMDRLMRKLGLGGRSVIPLIGGMACAVPAIMSTRTISNWRERLITIMVVPLTTCSARLPVYTLLIALVIPSEASFGIFNLQGLTFFGLYALGFASALTAALVMKLVIKNRGKSFFVMEMPEYRMPRWNNILLTMYEKVKVFVTDAGKVIIAISIVLWFLSSYGPGTTDRSGTVTGTEDLASSYAGVFGKAIEPAIEPLGFDWKIGIALITSFAAREVFVGTMATIYSVGDADNESSVREKMRAETVPGTTLKRYTPAVGLSLMVFYAFAMQCMSTIAVVYRETKGWKWPAIQVAYMTVLAYLSSLFVYQILS